MITMPEMIASRRTKREIERMRALENLRGTLTRWLPKGSRVWIYGSAVRPGKFHDESDIDLAIEDPSGIIDLDRITSELCTLLDRRIDVCRFEQTRLSSTISREGELWIL